MKFAPLAIPLIFWMLGGFVLLDAFGAEAFAGRDYAQVTVGTVLVALGLVAYLDERRD
jgi:hypothetical protein